MSAARNLEAWASHVLHGSLDLPLDQRVELLFAQQLESWPGLRLGIDALKAARTRTVQVRWFDVHVRLLQHRMVSTMARVDKESIEARPCFLCAANLPSEQKGIEFQSDFVLLANPYPILNGHLTVVHKDHRPQAIDGFLSTAIDLATALPDHLVLYNGPRCGASAPDHFHFQACRRDTFPIEHQTAAFRGPDVPDYSRRALLFRDTDRGRLARSVELALEALAAVTSEVAEPLVNLVFFSKLGIVTAIVFPRGKHRPEVYHSGEFLVSPGSIDLCGILVTPRLEDFERISSSVIDDVFQEVSLAADLYAALLAKLGEA